MILTRAITCNEAMIFTLFGLPVPEGSAASTLAPLLVCGLHWAACCRHRPQTGSTTDADNSSTSTTQIKHRAHPSSEFWGLEFYYLQALDISVL